MGAKLLQVKCYALRTFCAHGVPIYSVAQRLVSPVAARLPLRAQFSCWSFLIFLAVFNACSHYVSSISYPACNTPPSFSPSFVFEMVWPSKLHNSSRYDIELRNIFSYYHSRRKSHCFNGSFFHRGFSDISIHR